MCLNSLLTVLYEVFAELLTLLLKKKTSIKNSKSKSVVLYNLSVSWEKLNKENTQLITLSNYFNRVSELLWNLSATPELHKEMINKILPLLTKKVIEPIVNDYKNDPKNDGTNSGVYLSAAIGIIALVLYTTLNVSTYYYILFFLIYAFKTLNTIVKFDLKLKL